MAGAGKEIELKARMHGIVILRLNFRMLETRISATPLCCKRSDPNSAMRRMMVRLHQNPLGRAHVVPAQRERALEN